MENAINAELGLLLDLKRKARTVPIRPRRQSVPIMVA